MAELKSFADGSVEETVQELMVEATALVASYNMVSRFLVGLDVAGKSNDFVPWPVDREEVCSALIYFVTIAIKQANLTHLQHFITIPNQMPSRHATYSVRRQTHNTFIR